MIKNKDIAKRIKDIALECSSKLDNSVLVIEAECSKEEFEAYRRAVGKVMGEIFMEILTPLYNQHTEIKPVGMR